MNILFLIGKYPSYGGTEKVTTVLANAFTQKGLRVHIASFEQPVPDLQSELHSNIRLHKLSYPAKSKSNINILRNIILQNEIDIIINQWCLPFYVTQLCNKARKGTKCKLLAVHHNSPDSNVRIEHVKIKMFQRSNSIKRFYLNSILSIVKYLTSRSIRYVYYHSDKYILLSSSFINIFKQLIGIKKTPKLAVISNPVTLLDLDFHYLSEQKNREIIYVGRIDYNQKKVYRIIELWKQIENNYHDWRLTIVGDGPQKKDIEDLIETFNLKRVQVTGFQNPLEYYKRASILLLTSEYEGFGLVIVEGMCFGVIPVVYGSYAAVYDIIDNGKNGFITNIPYSQEETVACLKSLIENENQRKEIALKAIEKSKEFSLKSIVDQWENLFTTL